MKALPYFLMAGALAFTTACSSTSTNDNPTSGSNAAASSEATGMASGTNSASGGSPTSSGDVTSSNGLGTASSAGAGSADTGGAGGSGAGGATDMNAFMGTFATMEDPTFLLTAASSNMLEIQTGKLASQRATNAEVKNFAQMMVSHHTKATQQWQSVATPLGVAMPTAMMPIHQAMADQLANKTGKGFDEAYMDMMETAHKMDIAMFEAKTKSAQTPAVKTFATNTLPMLRSHETLANNLEKKVD